MSVVYAIPNLKRISLSTGRTIADLARETGIARALLHNLCRGSNASPATVHKICAVLDCKPTDLMQTPSLQSAIEMLVHEVRVYRRFVAAVYELNGDRLPDIE